MTDAASLEQHNREIQENRVFWQRKPALQKVYGDFYAEIAKRVKRTAPGLIVELGSGMGNIKNHIPECVTTDVFPNPWLDRVENAYALSFADESVGNIVLFDVWHHLQYPGAALKEFARALCPEGRLIVFEPAMGVFGKFVFGRFHHEPLGLEDEITWDAPPEFSAAAAGYYAAQGNASRVFGTTLFEEKLRGWRIVEVRRFSGLAYLGTGGFRGPQLFPEALLPCINWLDRLLTKAPALASRMLVVLDRAGGSK